jgi:hypothetical protein
MQVSFLDELIERKFWPVFFFKISFLCNLGLKVKVKAQGQVGQHCANERPSLVSYHAFLQCAGCDWF